MTMDPTAKLLNLKKSLDKSLYDCLAEQPTVIDWEGRVRDLTMAVEVVQPRLSLAGLERLGAGDQGPAEGLEWRLSLNIFVRPGADAGRLAVIRDALAEEFGPGRRVEFFDFDQDPPVKYDEMPIIKLTVDEGLPIKSGYLQHNLTVAGHLVQQWSG